MFPPDLSDERGHIEVADPLGRRRRCGRNRARDGSRWRVLEALLILLTESLSVCFSGWIEERLPALLPCRSEFWRCDVPVRAAILGNGTQVITQLFQSGPADEAGSRCRSFGKLPSFPGVVGKLVVGEASPREPCRIA